MGNNTSSEVYGKRAILDINRNPQRSVSGSKREKEREREREREFGRCALCIVHDGRTV